MSEIEAFPRAVLTHHYPETALHGDFTTIQAGDYGAIDVLVGGTPCQSFSVAGLRGGMEDARGNLALEYLRLAERLRPRWLVWENVPGVLSSGGGRDFGAFLGGLVELGYGFAYRVLDAQFFGLAQRRKRVFVVGCLGDWRRAAAVLFEPACLRGHPAPGREARERVAASLTRGADSGGKGGYARRWREDDENLAYGISPDCFDRSGEAATGTAADRSGLGVDCEIAYAIRAKRPGGVAMALNAHGGSGRLDGESETFVTSGRGWWDERDTGATIRSQDSVTKADTLVTHSLRADGFDASEDGTGRGTPLVAAINWQSGGDCRGLDPKPVTMALTKDQTPAITRSAVRRLTPRECEKLQGFAPDYTLIPWRNGMASDGPRYRALGNSMAVPCMAWIGRRLQVEHDR